MKPIETNWVELKKWFNSQKYTDKLKWWKEYNPNYYDWRFYYSQDDAPLIERYIFVLDTPGTNTLPDFLTIAPNNKAETIEFINWCQLELIGKNPEMRGLDFEKCIEYWRNTIEKMHTLKRISFLDEKINQSKSFIEDRNSRQPFFNMGTQYSTSDGLHIPDFGPYYFEGDFHKQIIHFFEGYNAQNQLLVLEHLKSEYLSKFNEVKTESEFIPEGIENKNDMQQIGLLYELGILDFLKEQYQLSPEKIGALLKSITGINPKTATGYIKYCEGVKNKKNNVFNTLKNRNFYSQVYANLSITPIKKGKSDEERER